MSSAQADDADNSISSQLVGSNTDNLYGVVDRDNVHGLNLTIPEDARAVIKPWDEREETTKYAESNVDDQMIIHVPFTQSVRVKSLLLKLGRGETTPRHLRIYANHPHIVDFSDAEQITPQLNLTLLEGETGVTEYPLRVAAFTSVNSLSLFFSEATGGELTRIYYIGFKGDSRSPKKEASNQLEVPAADAADTRISKRVKDASMSSMGFAR